MTTLDTNDRANNPNAYFGHKVLALSYGGTIQLFGKKGVRYGCPGCKQSVKRGDIAIFAYPNDRTVSYIKRVIGLPGDRVQVKGNEVWVNGKSLKVQQAPLGSPFSQSKYGPLRISSPPFPRPLKTGFKECA